MNGSWLIALAFVFALGFLALNGARSASLQTSTITAPVSRIVDGDTFYLKGERTRFRIWGINAPETDEEGGYQATQYLGRLIGKKSLRCEKRGRDRYGRHVVRCFLPDGRDIAAELIRAGHARELHQYTKGYYSK